MQAWMDAIVKPAPAEGLELRRVPVPSPGPGEVLIKIHKTAICGSDVHIYKWNQWAQLPVAGSQVPGNSQIILYMGAEKQATRVEVPDFIGCSVADVNYLASNAGLYVQAKGTDRTDVYVLAAYQDIDPGTEVDRGTTITVEFSSTGASD